MVVIRPGDLVIVDVEIEFNFHFYTKLEIDLRHINRGKGFTRETNYSIDQVAFLAKSLLHGDTSDLYIEKIYGDESCTYFTIYKTLGTKQYKIVFCSCTDQKNTLGIITLHRSRRQT